MIHTRFYNQILIELQAGNVLDGISLLVGMLDTVNSADGSLANASAELRAHDLYRLILEDPLCAHAAKQGSSATGLIDMICDQAVDASASVIGQRLFGVTTELTFARAIRERVNTISENIMRGWQQGAKICVLEGDYSRALATLAGQDLSNLTVVDSDLGRLNQFSQDFGYSVGISCASSIGFLKCARRNGARFDLICAADLADRNDASALARLISAMRDCLATNGKIIVTSFAPAHLGAGWRTACLRWDLQCHDESDLIALADDAGLKAQSYRDATDCIVWSEMKIAVGGNLGGVHHGL